MKKSLNVLIAVMSLSLMLSACGKKKDSNDATVAAARDTRVGSGGTGSVLPSGQTYSPGQPVSVFAQDSMITQFNEAIKILVSATMDPANVGNVDNRNGVKLRGVISLNCTSGVMNPASSKIEVSIQDDLKNSDGELYEPIIITVLGASGTASNSNVNVTFSDQYGLINLVGTYDSSNFTGDLKFKNTTAYKGKTEGTLGSFKIPLSEIFKCN